MSESESAEQRCSTERENWEMTTKWRSSDEEGPGGQRATSQRCGGKAVKKKTLFNGEKRVKMSSMMQYLFT